MPIKTVDLLVAFGCAIVALSIMLAGQYAASVIFPVTPDVPATPAAPAPATSDFLAAHVVRLHVPFWAPIAHVAAGAVAGLVGGFLVARLAPGALWPVSIVGGVLAAWELFTVADIPKSMSFSVTAAAVLFASTWLGAAFSQIRVKPVVRL